MPLNTVTFHERKQLAVCFQAIKEQKREAFSFLPIKILVNRQSTVREELAGYFEAHKG